MNRFDNANGMYTVEYFIKKFEAIPENEWCEHSFSRYNNANMTVEHCVLGHCGIKTTKQSNIEAQNLLMLTENKDLRFFEITDKLPIIAQINDGIYSNFTQSTPKQRVLAFLYNLKAKEKPIDRPCFHLPTPKAWKTLSVQMVNEEGCLV
jgi:hypothetical protein